MSDRPLAVITGASAGIGATFARKLAQRGYDLVLIARREDRLRALAAELAETYHIDVSPIPADLAAEDDLERVAGHVQNAPRLRLLVNNAGFGTLGFFQEADVRRQMQMHRLHVLAITRLTHAALVNMAPRRAGAVINVSSVAAFMIGAGNVSYCATKAWINAFTQGLALELSAKKSPVKMQALCPGFVLSEFHDVLGMDRAPVPKSFWLTADFVVEQSLLGLDAGRLFVIPGLRYKMTVFALRWLPDPILRRIARFMSRRRRPKK
ncbi:MAG TPA: SDR family oxidoreductase [Bryobacteraceae bacterium]|jgi:short-subunit dehydrogenase|nr:SDR family oxidoreductase [Bryobacteraceae bacterium]